MQYFVQFIKLRNLYNFFLYLALVNIFFSTDICYSKTLEVNDVEISTSFEINFEKNKIIEVGFIKAFNRLILSTVQTKDQLKLKTISLEQIKGMVETFSIKDEKFINDEYYVNLSVSFNKKNLFKLLEEKNVFPSLPIKKDIIFIPIIIDQNLDEIQMFSENVFFNIWNSKNKEHHLLNYILPTEDLEDFSIIKNNFKDLENFDFRKIVNKYNLQDYIVLIIFKNNDQVKLLNKISLNDTKTIKNINFNKLNFNNQGEIIKFIKKLKIIYEDFWKSQNEINTSVKLALTISIQNFNNIKINQFEKKLSNIDLIYNYYIYKFDNKNNYYKIIFNGTPDKFFEIMKANNYVFENINKIWVMR